MYSKLVCTLTGQVLEIFIIQIQMEGSKAPHQILSNHNQRIGILREPETRKISIIQSTIRKQKNYFDRIRGDRQETKQLNIHAKTLNEKYLKKAILANQLNEQDIEVLGKYKVMSANFQSAKFLYDSISDETKDMCRQYSKSSEIVKDIFSSDRMFFNNKIIFVKFLKKIESGIDKPNISWKQEYFKNKKKPNTSAQNTNIDLNLENNQVDIPIPEQIEEQSQNKVVQNAKNQQKNEKITVQNEEDGQNAKIETKTVRKKLFMKKVGSANTQPKQVKQISAFGQSSFGGGFIFSLNNNNNS